MKTFSIALRLGPVLGLVSAFFNNAYADFDSSKLSANNISTHTTLPAAGSAPSFQVAGVYWLPDYLERNLDFNARIQDADTIKRIKRDCASLGYAIPDYVLDWNKYTYKEFSAADKLRCYKNFSCKSNYNKTSCPKWYQLGAVSCQDEQGTFYSECVATPCAQGSTKLSDKPGYDKTANGQYSGAVPCYEYTPKPCSGYGNMMSGFGWDCSDTCLSGTVTKYKCIAKACPSSTAVNPGCDAVNYNTVASGSYSGNSACFKCEAKPCPVGKTCPYGCKNYDISRQEMCGKICVECNICYPGGNSSCSGQTTSCESGGKVETSSCLDCQGNRRYTCRAKTCSERNLLDMNTYWCNGALKCWLGNNGI